MNNQELAETFVLIADLLEIKGENIYKTMAYRKTAESLFAMGEDINQVWRQGKLIEALGVGKTIAGKIEELLSTGKLDLLERLKVEIPLSLVDLLRVPSLGPKKAALFWQQLGVTNLQELETAARAGKLSGLPGMGEKSEAKIIAGLEALARHAGRHSMARAWPAAEELLTFLRSLPGVARAEMAGSLRRMRPTIGDLNLIIAASDPQPIMEAFVHHTNVIRIVSQGETKSSVDLNNRLRAQLLIRSPERFGTGWQYSTGSKVHNLRLGEIAQKRGLSLAERGFTREDGAEILCATEEEVYQALGLPWIPPELREDRGEVQAALAGQLPRLICRADLKADLHTHSTWSDGQLLVEEMAEAALERGFSILAITDHTYSLGIVGGLTAEQLVEQRKDIDRVQRKMKGRLRLLQGAEVEIRADGTLDYPDEVLEKLDIVIASLHMSLGQPRQQVTGRTLNAIRNPHVDIIAHPTGRMLPDREGADLDMDAVLSASAEYGVALEINAHPSRLDLDDVYARRAAEMGIPIAINTDAHSASDFDLAFFGVAIARGAWLAPEQVINTWDETKLLNWLKSKKANFK